MRIQCARANLTGATGVLGAVSATGRHPRLTVDRCVAIAKWTVLVATTLHQTRTLTTIKSTLGVVVANHVAERTGTAGCVDHIGVAAFHDADRVGRTGGIAVTVGAPEIAGTT